MNVRNLTSLSNRSLMEQIQNDDSEAIGELILRYEQLLRKIIYGNVGDIHATEDVFGETCLAVVKRLRENATDIKDVDKWIKQVARSKCKDYWRKEKKYQKIIAVAEEYRAAALERELLKDLRRDEALEVVHEMEPIYREVAMLWWQGFTIAEIAEQLGISENIVKHRRRDIARMLREYFGVPPPSDRKK